MEKKVISRKININMNTSENGINEDHGNPCVPLLKDLRVMCIFPKYGIHVVEFITMSIIIGA
jgi:hypothetical protein